MESGGIAVLAVLSDGKKETVSVFFASIPEVLWRTIERICTDRYKGFVEAAREQVPGAKIGVDRFHVARAYRDCTDAVRKKEIKRLKKELSDAQYEEVKGAMWPLRKRPPDLEEEEWALLARLFTYSPKLETAYNLREDLTELFERQYTKRGRQVRNSGPV